MHTSLTTRTHTELVPAEGLELLRRDDAAFEAGAFLGRVRSAFLHAQAAWSRGDLRPVRPFLSDVAHRQLADLLARDRGRGMRSVVWDVRVREARIAAVEAGPEVNRVEVTFRSDARRAEVPCDAPVAEVRQMLRGKKPRPFVESWTLLRRAGVQTTDREGTLEGCCPACGVVIDAADSPGCSGCGAAGAAAAHDWMLAEIRPGT